MEFYTYAYVVQRGEFTGLQVNDYTRDVDNAEESNYMVQFLNNFSETEHVNKEKVRVNSLRVHDRMIVNIDDKFFEVTFTMNKDGYALRPIHMMNANPKVVDVKKDER